MVFFLKHLDIYYDKLNSNEERTIINHIAKISAVDIMNQQCNNTKLFGENIYNDFLARQAEVFTQFHEETLKSWEKFLNSHKENKNNLLLIINQINPNISLMKTSLNEFNIFCRGMTLGNNDFDMNDISEEIIAAFPMVSSS